MRIVISGASGLVGTALCKVLADRGDTAVRLVRREPEGADEIRWDPAAGKLDSQALEGCDAVVHLSGENVAGLWTRAKKQAILDSRVNSTRTICEALAAMENKPGVFVCASAMGIYGDSGDEPLDENAPHGQSFLADVCRAWEAEAKAAEQAGIRTVRYRIGLVLSAEGGALAQMLTPFKLGLGGPLGDGKQYMSWVALDDVVGGIVHCIDTEAISGAVNAGSPNPVTNNEFTAALGRAVHRPAFFRAPKFALKLAAGEMADEMLLSSIRMRPEKLMANGYRFAHPTLDEVLEATLQK